MVELSKIKGLFAGGLNLRSPEKSINDGDSPEIWNVEFTKEHLIKGRDFTTEKGSLPDDPDLAPGNPIKPKGSYSFIDENTVNWYVLTNNKYHFISDDLVNWTNINPANPVNADYTTRMTYINGKIYGTNGISDVWSYDITGPTLTQHPTLPKGRYIVTHNERLTLINVPGQNNWVNYSNIDDETNFYHPVKVTIPNKFRVDIRMGGQITGAISYEAKLIIFTSYSVSVWKGWDDRDFVLQTISQQVGCANGATIQEFNGFIVWLGTDGNFYKTDGRNIMPIGDAIEPELKEKMVQVFTYQETFYKHGAEGTMPWTDAAGGTVPEFIYPNGSNYNSEPSFIPASMVNFGNAASVVRNSYFASGWTNWYKNPNWNGSYRSIGSGSAGWTLNGGMAEVRTEFTIESFGPVTWTSHITNVNKVELIFVDAHSGNEIGGVRRNPTTSVQRTPTVFMPAFTHNTTLQISNNNPAFYDETWGTWKPADLKYRKIKIRAKVWRLDYTISPDGFFVGSDDGGYAYCDCDAGYVSNSGWVQYDFRVEPISNTDERFRFKAMLGFQTQTTTSTEYYYTNEISLPDVDKWAGFYAQYDNLAGSTVEFQYRVYDVVGAVWNPTWTTIAPGANIVSPVVDTPVRVQFRIRSYSPTDAYELVHFTYIGFYTYTKNEDLPNVDSDMSSLVYDGKYYCAMGIYGMGVWNYSNNVVFVLDEYGGRPRWARWDPFIETMALFVNKPQMWNANGGFVFDPEKYEMTQAEFENFNVGMPFYYRTKDWNFGLQNIQKRFKYIDFDIDCRNPRGNPNKYPFFHIEPRVDGQLSGTWLNYYLNTSLTPDVPMLISEGILTRVAKVYPMNLFSHAVTIYNAWRMYYEYPLPQKIVIGFGDRLGMVFRFATVAEDDNRILKLNYDIISMVIYMEIKDYQPMDFYKGIAGRKGIRSDIT